MEYLTLRYILNENRLFRFGEHYNPFKGSKGTVFFCAYMLLQCTFLLSCGTGSIVKPGVDL